MGKPTGFMEIPRETPTRRPIPERVNDYLEVYNPFPEDKLRHKGARCMDCGIPFCHQGCPLGNLIPDWNDLVYRDQWRAAIDRLHATNNFPEFTGTLCPAPCEASCVLGINDDPVTIKQIEQSIIDRAWNEGWIVPEPAKVKTGKKVAVVGSGPAGLAAAQQLARAGHDVTVFERADRIGGLLRYGIPDFKMEKIRLDRRLQQMEAEGVVFKPGINVGVDVTADATPRPVRRRLPLRRRDLAARPQDRRPRACRASTSRWNSCRSRISAVAGDRDSRGARSSRRGQTRDDHRRRRHRRRLPGHRSPSWMRQRPPIRDRAPASRKPDARPNPWPQWSNVFRVSSAHEEGGAAKYAINTKRFVGANGRVTALETIDVEMKPVDGRMQFVEIPGSEKTFQADLVLLAMGFLGPERKGMLEQFGVELDAMGNVKSNADRATSVSKVFTAGDMTRGQSLIVWAIAEGRHAAQGIDAFLDRRVRPAPPARLRQPSTPVRVSRFETFKHREFQEGAANSDG